MENSLIYPYYSVNRVNLFKISCLQDCKRTEHGTCRTGIY